jgi:hypothetical protein
MHQKGLVRTFEFLPIIRSFPHTFRNQESKIYIVNQPEQLVMTTYHLQQWYTIISQLQSGVLIVSESIIVKAIGFN